MYNRISDHVKRSIDHNKVIISNSGNNCKFSVNSNTDQRERICENSEIQLQERITADINSYLYANKETCDVIYHGTISKLITVGKSSSTSQNVLFNGRINNTVIINPDNPKRMCSQLLEDVKRNQTCSRVK